MSTFAGYFAFTFKRRFPFLFTWRKAMTYDDIFIISDGLRGLQKRSYQQKNMKWPTIYDLLWDIGRKLKRTSFSNIVPLLNVNQSFCIMNGKSKGNQYCDGLYPKQAKCWVDCHFNFNFGRFSKCCWKLLRFLQVESLYLFHLESISSNCSFTLSSITISYLVPFA